MRSRLVCLALVAACHPSKIDLDKLLAAQTRGLYACFESQAATRPGFAGHLDAKVEVDTTGRVVTVEITASTFPDDSVLPCLLRAWRAVRVPPPDHATGHMRLVWQNSCGSTPLAPGKGSMDKAMIRAVVRSHLDEVRACYEKTSTPASSRRRADGATRRPAATAS